MGRTLLGWIATCALTACGGALTTAADHADGGDRDGDTASSDGLDLTLHLPDGWAPDEPDVPAPNPCESVVGSPQPPDDGGELPLCPKDADAPCKNGSVCGDPGFSGNKCTCSGRVWCCVVLIR
jgi:hypothetical protein